MRQDTSTPRPKRVTGVTADVRKFLTTHTGTFKLEDVVAYTDAYWTPKYAEQAQAKAIAKRLAEDKAFMIAIAALEIL